MNTFTGSTKEAHEEMSNILFKQGEEEKGEILARLMSSYMCNGAFLKGRACRPAC